MSWKGWQVFHLIPHHFEQCFMGKKTLGCTQNLWTKVWYPWCILGRGQYVESTTKIFWAQLKDPLVLQHAKPPPCEFPFYTSWILIILMDGSKFFKLYQNLVTSSPFFGFLHSLVLPCKSTFMDVYDGI